MISVFDLFKIGIGPSSSHTIGPMRAAYSFLTGLEARNALMDVARIDVDLYGSLASTGSGHGTDTAILLGLCGEVPEAVDPTRVPDILGEIDRNQRLSLLGKHAVPFVKEHNVRFHADMRLPFHPNAMSFVAEAASGATIETTTYYSIGGGFVLNEHECNQATTTDNDADVPFPFTTSGELLQLGQQYGLSIATMTLENEKIYRTQDAIVDGLRTIRRTMEACIDRGCHTQGILDGGLGLRRRASGIYQQLLESQEKVLTDPLTMLDWIDLWALAVSEENAAGGRVVTAPTNGAAGIIPAVLRYYNRFHATANEQGEFAFLFTAAAIGSLYKRNASLSGAEVGCQGEVGVACSMAAAGLTAALGGTNAQIEEAAEIAMEHNLGLTCDPVKGLVQVPCIERNAMGAVKAINASRLARRGTGQHIVSLDNVIETMRQIGADMHAKYKETSKGGLAVNVVEC